MLSCTKYILKQKEDPLDKAQIEVLSTQNEILRNVLDSTIVKYEENLSTINEIKAKIDVLDSDEGRREFISKAVDLVFEDVPEETRAEKINRIWSEIQKENKENEQLKEDKTEV